MIGGIINFLIVYSWIIIPVVVVVALFLSRAARAGGATVLRLIARPLLLLAVVALVYDGTSTIAGGSGLVVTSLADHWKGFHAPSLLALQAMVNKLHPLAWESGALRLLKLPAWAVIGAIGLLLAAIGRKRRRVNVYVN